MNKREARTFRTVLTSRVPEHALRNRRNELGGLEVAVHGGPASLQVQVELETITESQSTANDQEDQRVEENSNK